MRVDVAQALPPTILPDVRGASFQLATTAFEQAFTAQRPECPLESGHGRLKGRSTVCSTRAHRFPASVRAYRVSPAPTMMYCLPSSIQVDGPLLTGEV